MRQTPTTTPLRRRDALRRQRWLAFGGWCFLAVVILAPIRLLACGPWLPEEILTSRQVILRTPVGDFAQEVVALTPEDGAPPLPAGLVRLPPQGRVSEWDWDEAPAQVPFKNELAELSDALDHQGMSATQREKVLTAYGLFRRGMLKIPLQGTSAPCDDDPDTRFDLRAREVRRMEPQPTPAPRTLPTELSEGLPAEWVDYVTGAAAFWSNDLTGARQAWERLLARPQFERLYCSTWAAYMLARILDEPSAAREENAKRYQRVRELRVAGCRDLFNLASASLGWEARLALDQGDCGAAVRLYYLQAITSHDELGQIGGSLRAVVDKVIPKTGPDPAVAAAAATDPFLRRVVTLYLACDRTFGDNDDDENGQPEASAPNVPASAPSAAGPPACQRVENAWLAALTQSGVTSAQEAAPIAWAAYEKGDYTHAVAWLAKAPPEDGLALWLRAKLALRDGKTEAAAAFFAQAVHSYPVEIKDVSNSLDDAISLSIDGRAFRTSQFHADLGIISLSQGDYAQALTALLRSGFWRDAAYVAERVMTADELLAYVRTNFPQAPAAVGPPKPEIAPVDPVDPDEPPPAPPTPLQTIQSRITVDHSANKAAYATRYLLARRLSRLGRYGEAGLFYPAALLPKFDQYAAARNLGDDAKKPAARRAEALWTAAKIERWLGMELFGTEDDPDWFIENGAYDEDKDIREVRLGRLDASDDANGAKPATEPVRASEISVVPSVGADEKRRIAQDEVTPPKRYHYRYLAADLAWKAAALMPDQNERTALVLGAGGQWLESMQEDQGADRFYHAILRRCGRTKTGREFEKLGGIPDIEHQDF